MVDKNRTACFTGHRIIPYSETKKIELLLNAVIDELYKEGVIYFGAGGSYGFDMLAEMAVLRAKKRHKDIKLILVLPCKDQDKFWTENSKRKYAEIIKQADKVVYTSETYYNGCMLKRNRHLVNFSGYCVAYLTTDTGGTAYTVRYAQQNALEVINIAEPEFYKNNIQLKLKIFLNGLVNKAKKIFF